MTFARNESLLNASLVNNSLPTFEGGNSEDFAVEVVKLVVEILIAFFGLIGNILVVVVTSRLGQKKGSVDLYITHLAVADLGTLLLIFPVVVLREKLPMNWPLGEFTCLYVSSATETFYGSSVWCIVLIAMERYRNIVKIKVKRRRSKASLKSAKIIAAFVWFASFLVFSIPLYFVVEYREHNKVRWCGAVWGRSLLLPRVYFCLLTAFSFIVPLIVVSWTFFAIARKLSRSSTFIKSMKYQTKPEISNNHPPRQSTIENLRLRQNRRANQVLTPIAIVFAITMLPLNMLRLTFVFWPEIVYEEYYRHFFYAATVFVILNSSANPVIYSLVSKDFRQEIRQLFGGRRRGRVPGFSGFELRGFNGSRSSQSSHSAPAGPLSEQNNQQSSPQGKTG